MSSELEALIRAWEAVEESMASGVASEARDKEVEQRVRFFDSLLDDALERHPALSRETLLEVVRYAHRKWARKQDRKPPFIPPTA